MKELNTNVDAFVSSIFYLEREAKKDGYEEVSRILRSAIESIDRWILEDNAMVMEKELGSDLYNALLILTAVRKIGKSKINEIYKEILSIDRSS